MSPSLATSRRARGESGDTLIEVLVALVIMGAAFAIIVGGIGTAIIGASVQQNQTTADSLLRSAADKVASSSTPYTTCADPSVYDATLAASPPLPAGYAVHVVNVAYWDPGTNQFTNPTPCADSGLQLVTIRAVSAPTNVHAPQITTLDVVKRQP